MRGTRGVALAGLLAIVGGLMFLSADSLVSAFVPSAASQGRLQMPNEALGPGHLAPVSSPAPKTHSLGVALALVGCLAASLRLRGRSTSLRRAHLVQLKAEPSEKDSKKDAEEDKEDEEDEEDDFEDEDEDDEEGLDELVMEDEDDDEEDFDDEFEDEDDDDIVYEEDELDDSYFATDEEGEVLEAVCRARFLNLSPTTNFWYLPLLIHGFPYCFFQSKRRVSVIFLLELRKGSAWKFRRVLYQIRGRSYREALMLLEFMPWRACRPTLCALQSAAANAQNHFNMDKSRLYIYQCKAEKGPYSNLVLLFRWFLTFGLTKIRPSAFF